VFDFRRTLTRKKVVVNLLSSRAFVGILWAQRGPLLVLRNVTMHEPGAAPASVDGEVVIERDQVEFIQVTTG
jgi:small nuclear ribonucleoprotein (snRNP)-like protein